MLDLVVRGGLIVDGDGGGARTADVGVMGERIVEVGNLGGVSAALDLDAHGLVVTPGFIDVHSHSDFTLFVDPRAQSSVAQGVTTELVGNCGHGCSPVSDPRLVKANTYGYLDGIEFEWTTLGEYLDRIDQIRPAVNVATLVPNGNLRFATVGLSDRPARPDEVAQMVRLLEQGLDAGAIGLSTGLEYPGERGCSREELVALSTVVARRGGVYATHTRNYEAGTLDAMKEQIEVAEAAGVKLHLSHIVPRRCGDADLWLRALALVDAAVANGLDVTFDAHTRLVGITNLSNVLPPEEFMADRARLVGRLESLSVRREMKAYESIIASFGKGGWDKVFLYNSPSAPEKAGRNFTELTPPGGDPFDAIFDVLLAEAERPHVPLCICDCRDEEWLRGTFKHPLCMVGSDAPALCPDGPLSSAMFLGAYTWVGWFYRRLVRELADLSLEEAVQRMTSMPADRFGLQDRGRLRAGGYADLAVFDPATFGEVGTTWDPNHLAVGMRHVIVNGVLSCVDGVITGERGGRVLRASS